MQYFIKLIVPFIIPLVYLSLITAASYNKQYYVSNTSLVIEGVENKISLEQVLSNVKNHYRNIESLCPKGSSPIFNELSFTCKVDNNNKYVSSKLNSNAKLINTLVIDLDDRVLTRSNNIDAVDLITGQTASVNTGELSFRENIFGKQIYIDREGDKYQYINMYYEADLHINGIDPEIGLSSIFMLRTDKYMTNIDIKAKALEEILTQAIYNKESRINYATIRADQAENNYNEYITSSVLIDYSDSNWNVLIKESEGYLEEISGIEKKDYTNNAIRNNSNMINGITIYDPVLLNRTIAQGQDID